MSRHAETHGFADKRLRLKHVEQVLVMPQDGIGAVVALIGSARLSMLIKMFTFDSPVLVEAVVAAQARGRRGARDAESAAARPGAGPTMRRWRRCVRPAWMLVGRATTSR